jgi:octaprenyl-diphosphate synthase
MIDLHNIHQTVQTELNLLNAKLLGAGRLEYRLVRDIVIHVISNGKRVRPILLFLIAKAFGVKNTNAIISSAFAVEMIHTASLLHDDVVDETKKRRGKKTANTLWGNKETILVGDHLFTQSFLAITELNNFNAIKIITDASSRLTIGEITQLENEQNIDLSTDEYLKIIYHKTASLFEASAQLGALFSETGSVEHCGTLGKNLGFAFQIIDDILDYKGSKTLGKDVGTDFKERKVTLPVLLLLKEVNKNELKVIKSYFHKNGEMTLREIIIMMEKYNIFVLCKEFMDIFVNSASVFIEENIQNKHIQNMLITLLNFFTKREF